MDTRGLDITKFIKEVVLCLSSTLVETPFNDSRKTLYTVLKPISTKFLTRDYQTKKDYFRPAGLDIV